MWPHLDDVGGREQEPVVTGLVRLGQLEGVAVVNVLVREPVISTVLQYSKILYSTVQYLCDIPVIGGPARYPPQPKHLPSHQRTVLLWPYLA